MSAEGTRWERDRISASRFAEMAEKSLWHSHIAANQLTGEQLVAGALIHV